MFLVEGSLLSLHGEARPRLLCGWWLDPSADPLGSWVARLLVPRSHGRGAGRRRVGAPLALLGRQPWLLPMACLVYPPPQAMPPGVHAASLTWQLCSKGPMGALMCAVPPLHLHGSASVSFGRTVPVASSLGPSLQPHLPPPLTATVSAPLCCHLFPL